MSTLKTIYLQHLNGANTNATLDANGNMTVTGTVCGASSNMFRNRIINGDMRIDQRNAGASVTPTATNYTVDRWRFATNISSKITLQQQAIASPQSCENNRYTLSCSTASSYSLGAGEYFGINHFVEGYNMADLGWGTSVAKAVTLSFWVYCGLTGTFGGAIRTGDGSNYSYPFTYTISSANTWEKKSITIPGPTSGTWNSTNGQGLDVWFSLGTGSTYSGTANTWAAANYVNATGTVNLVGTASGSGGNWYITGVQLEVGTAATPFEFRHYTTELQLCQRYYEVAYNSTGNYQFIGALRVSGDIRSRWHFAVQKRTNPTFALGSSGSWAGSFNTAYPSINGIEFYGTADFYLTTGAGTVNLPVATATAEL